MFLSTVSLFDQNELSLCAAACALAGMYLQASNISDALVRPQAAEVAASCCGEAAEGCYDEDGNPEPVPQRVPNLPGPPVHPLQVWSRSAH